jgi:hypothetical protein
LTFWSLPVICHIISKCPICNIMFPYVIVFIELYACWCWKVVLTAYLNVTDCISNTGNK